MSPTSPIGWPTAQRISDIPAVHEALEAFSHDSTEDNAVGLICEVLNATPLTMKSAPPVAWQVWWGLMEKKAIWPPFATEDEAKQRAEQIRSNTEIPPLYASQLALPAGPVPEGWKLVPIRPTRDMLVAAGFARGDGEEQWSDMLDAAPSPAVAQPVAAFKTQPTTEQVAIVRERLEAAGLQKVAQPVADERVPFEVWARVECNMPAHVPVNWDATWVKQAWEGWQARAALCQPAEDVQPAAITTQPEGGSE